ncbi:MAG: flavin reductase family protein [Gemmatimonadetes bacterium]|nr:flavin reductase family protein [Gemmatimonadota bacterium]
MNHEPPMPGEPRAVGTPRHRAGGEDPSHTLLDSNRFREIMGHYPTGVTVVTAVDRDGAPVGLTANSVTSVSLDPPLVLVCVSEQSASLGAILASGTFAVNILGGGAAETAVRFAGMDREDRFDGIAYTVKEGGGPILEGVLAWIACGLYRTFEAGDHLILVGKVLDGAGAEGDPLLFFRSRYETLDAALTTTRRGVEGR